MKLWMVEGCCKLDDGYVASIRSVVEAKSKKEAEKLSEAAILERIKILTNEENPKSRLVGKPSALYPI